MPFYYYIGKIWRIALDLLDEMKPQLPAYEAIVFDAGYGVVLPLLSELEKRGEPDVAQVPSNVAAWPADAVATLVQPTVGRPLTTRGRARSRHSAAVDGAVARAPAKRLLAARDIAPRRSHYGARRGRLRARLSARQPLAPARRLAMAAYRRAR